MRPHAVVWVVVSIGCTGSERASTTSQAVTACVDLPAARDALIANPPMGMNYGSDPILRVGGKDESLLGFDLGSIPEHAVVESAALRLYVAKAGDGTAIDVHRVTADWSEATATFASFAQHYDAAIAGTLSVTNSNVLKSIDVTALATEWLTGGVPNFGVLVETSSNKKVTFVSREGGTAEQRPALRVCYATPPDHCAPNPCQNGGVCENGEAGYVCHCAPGFDGAQCERNIDDCAGHPCLNNGTCNDGVGTYTCSCVVGFTGANCETNIDDCADHPCQNDGVCEDGIATHTCHCPPGYTGANCEVLVDNCATLPCQHGGTCINGVDSYTCQCATGFTGANCEVDIDDCAASPCHNGGTCIDGIASYSCVCPPDWGGPACDVNLNSCLQSPCLNGGTCTNTFGSYTCTCAPGFTGANCEVDIDECAPHPCDAGRLCVDHVNGYTCECDRSGLPSVCTSIAGVEGRCLSAATQTNAIFPQSSCAIDEQCAPCFDPTADDPTASTGACSTGCDSPTNPPVLLTCPWTGPNVYDPTALPACSPTCNGAHCMPADLTPPEAQPLLAACAGGYCTPDTFIATAGNVKPPGCAPYAGVTNSTQGRCVSSCVPSVLPLQPELSSCASGEACEPCWDPFTGTSTGACSMSSCDAPPATAFKFPNCCVAGGQVHGRCVPKGQIPDSDEGNLTAQECGSIDSDYLCVPNEQLPAPYNTVGRSCRGTSFMKPNGYDGTCLSTCLAFPFGTELLYSQGNCPANYLCVGCADAPAGSPGC